MPLSRKMHHQDHLLQFAERDLLNRWAIDNLLQCLIFEKKKWTFQYVQLERTAQSAPVVHQEGSLLQVLAILQSEHYKIVYGISISKSKFYLFRKPIDDEYEEIDGQTTEEKINQDEIAKRLHSGDVISKMKDRPLPPPPRPKRDNKKQKKFDDDDKLDKDGGAEQIIITEPPIEIESEPEIKLENIESEVESQPNELDKLDVEKLQRMSTFESDFSESSFDRPIEVEVSTQTDPVLDEDFLDDDEDIDLDEYIRDGKLKTLEEILKEEQEAEIERARQLAEAENLSRGIQRFRESSQRSYSERSRTSADGRKTPLSGRITPAAVVVEHKKSSPIIFNDEKEVVTEAALFVHPIEMERSRDEYDYEDENLPESEFITEPELELQLQIEEEIEILEFTQERQELPEPQETLLNLEPEIVETIKEPLEIERTVEEPQSKDVPDFVEVFPEQPPEPPERTQKSKKIVIQEPEIDQHEIDFEALVDDIIPNDDVIFDEMDFTDRLESQIRREIDQMVESIVAEAEIKADEIKTSQQELRQLDNEPPVAPPRKKSLGTDLEAPKDEEVNENVDNPRIDITLETQPQEQDMYVPDEIEQPEVDTIEYTRNSQPERLHLSNLEIDNLSVSSLQAGRITVSELDSHTITTNELECKSGSLVTRSIEIPAGLIDEIVERVKESTQQQLQLQQQQQEEKKKQEKLEESAKPATEKTDETKEKESKEEQDAPQRPPLPQYMYPDYPGFSVIPPSFYQMRNYSDEEMIPPQASHRRRRQVRKRDSTSEEEYQREQRTKSRNSTRSPEPSVAALGGQFLRACGSSIHQQGTNLMEMLRACSKDENKRDLHLALIILIVIIAGLMMLNLGEKSVHHHHWDYFNPPDNQGRKV